MYINTKNKQTNIQSQTSIIPGHVRLPGTYGTAITLTHNYYYVPHIYPLHFYFKLLISTLHVAHLFTGLFTVKTLVNNSSRFVDVGQWE